jgi:hypothetical protein
MSGSRSAYARDRIHQQWIDRELDGKDMDSDETREVTVLPGHCPTCGLDYELARMLTGRREESDHCALCEQEEGR